MLVAITAQVHLKRIARFAAGIALTDDDLFGFAATILVSENIPQHNWAVVLLRNMYNNEIVGARPIYSAWGARSHVLACSNNLLIASWTLLPEAFDSSSSGLKTYVKNRI